MDRFRRHLNWTIGLYILLGATTVFVGCGCSMYDEPLKAQAVITTQTRDLTIVEVTNENWYNWTNIQIVVYARQGSAIMRFAPLYPPPELMESGKTCIVEIDHGKSYTAPNPGLNRWNGEIESISISVDTVKGRKSDTINFK